jgi:FkbM family methyltransferase
MNSSPIPERTQPVPRISCAQNMEDILLDRLFRGSVGTYIDIGANHPFVDSNTCYFHQLGWRGVNIEPAPAAHALFVQHRPDALNLRVAASDSDHEGMMTFHQVVNEDGLTGLSTLESSVADDYRRSGYRVEEIVVPVKTVASLIEEYQLAPPDLLSIDVECHEASVIRGIPFEHWQPKVLVIESTTPLSDRPSFTEWEPRLIEHGYLFACFNGVNRFYLRSDQADHRSLFETPVSALDHYLRREVVALSTEVDELRAVVRSHQESWAIREEDWKRRESAQQQLIVHAQHELRPYKLLDRLDLVGAGYRFARSLKRRLMNQQSS